MATRASGWRSNTRTSMRAGKSQRLTATRWIDPNRASRDRIVAGSMRKSGSPRGRGRRAAISPVETARLPEMMY